MSNPPSSSLLLRAAPALFVLLWSSGFIGGRLGIPHAGPFTFVLIRMAIVSVLLALAARVWKAPWPSSWREAAHVAVSGLLVHGVYLCGVLVAMQKGLKPGMTALIVGLQPLLTAFASAAWLREAIKPRQWAGLMLGLAGVGLVVSQNLSVAAGPAAFAAAVLALLGITFGTLYQKRFCAGMDLRTGAAIQYFVSALATLAPAVFLEDLRVEWTGEFIFALVWLVLVLSVGAIFLLFLLIRRGRMAQVASLFYLTPPMTAVMSWVIFGQELSPLALAGFAVTACGVAMTRHAPPPAEPGAAAPAAS